MIVVICVGVFSFLVNMFQPKIRGAEGKFRCGGRGGSGGFRVCHGKGGSFCRRNHPSPVSSKVLEVYKKSGDRVQKDEPLLQLIWKRYGRSTKRRRSRWRCS